MASTSYATISSSELSHLVLEYLHSEGFTDTTEKFQEEAAGLLKNGNIRQAFRPKGRSRELRPLRSILSEYLSLVEVQNRKKQLIASNPLAMQFYKVLEEQEVLHQDRQSRQALANANNLPSYYRSAGSRDLVAASPSPIVSPGTIKSNVYGQQSLVQRTGDKPSRKLFGSEDTPSPHTGRKKGTPRKKRQHGRDNQAEPEGSKRHKLDGVDSVPPPLLNLASGLAEHINAGRSDGGNVDGIFQKLTDDFGFNEDFLEEVLFGPEEIPEDGMNAKADKDSPLKVNKRQSLEEYLKDNSNNVDKIIDRIDYNNM